MGKRELCMYIGKGQRRKCRKKTGSGWESSPLFPTASYFKFVFALAGQRISLASWPLFLRFGHGKEKASCDLAFLPLEMCCREISFAGCSDGRGVLGNPSTFRVIKAETNAHQNVSYTNWFIYANKEGWVWLLTIYHFILVQIWSCISM